MAKRKDRVIGLALGSGAARGWAHLGVILALREMGDPSTPSRRLLHWSSCWRGLCMPTCRPINQLGARII